LLTHGYLNTEMFKLTYFSYKVRTAMVSSAGSYSF